MKGNNVMLPPLTGGSALPRSGSGAHAVDLGRGRRRGGQNVPRGGRSGDAPMALLASSLHRWMTERVGDRCVVVILNPNFGSGLSLVFKHTNSGIIGQMCRRSYIERNNYDE